MYSDFAGWPLAYAVKRITGSEELDDLQFWNLVHSGRLMVFGMRSTNSHRERICAPTYNSLTESELDGTLGMQIEGQYFIEIQIYPVLHAPNAANLLNSMSLADAFQQLVLCDPEVQFLSSEAIKVSPKLEDVYLKRECGPGLRVWPVTFEFGNLAGGMSKGDQFYGSTDNPVEVQNAADAVCHRYGALLTLLRDEKLQAFGIPARPGISDKIPSETWWSRFHYFDATRGEILETEDPEPSDWHHSRLKRWSAVTLRLPQWSELFHVQPLAPDELRSSTTESRQVSTTPHKAEARAVTLMTSHDACVDWLTGIMRASPEERIESRKSLWNQAKKRWPGTLSERSFDAARKKAIGITKAIAWGAAGAPKKSPR